MKKFLTTREEIIEAMARTAFCVAWADNQEELAGRDLPHENLSGCEIFDVAPETPDYAREYANKLAVDIEARNSPLDEMFAAAQVCEFNEDEKEFGYLLMMGAQGQGVGWGIDYDTPEFDLPYTETLMYEGDDVCPPEEDDNDEN